MRLDWIVRGIALLFLLLRFSSVWAQPDASRAQDTPLAARPDDLTRAALHSAFLGRQSELLDLAYERKYYEKRLAGEGRSIVTLSENIAALAAACEQPAPDRREALALLRDFDQDGETGAFVQLVQRTEPRDRFRSAQDAHRYERLYRRLNTLTNAVGGAIQLQLFALFQVPIDVVQSMTIDRKYLTPEQRRQLYAAREVATKEVAPPPGAKATVRDWTPRRVNTAALQANRNGAHAAQQRRFASADWWYRRELLLRGEVQPFRDEHASVIRHLANEDTRRRESLSVTDGENFAGNAELEHRYSELLGQLIRDSANPKTAELAQNGWMRFPRAAVADEMLVVSAVSDRNAGETGLAMYELQQIAKGSSDWGRRMDQYFERADFNPGRAFDEAREAVDDRKWDFLLNGSDPSIQTRHLSSEETRVQESAWIIRARSLFVLDTIARAFAYPFLPKSTFPRDEIIEASHGVPHDYLASPEGRRDLRSLANAYAAERQYADAARFYEKLGEPGIARSMRLREASRLMSLAKDSPNPREQVRYYERILNGYPEFKQRKKAQRLLDEARLESEVLARISVKELKAQKEIWQAPGLGLDAILLDGDKSNGEIDSDGVALLAGSRVAYKDHASQERIISQVDEQAFRGALQHLFPRRRVQALREELNRPREIKRVPLQIEGGALPGIDAAPGLVPLEPNQRQRRLYE